jgi:hypothetical protein
MTATLTDRPADTLDRKPPLACCPNWNHEELVPLIPTFVFPQYEFYCLECGRNVAFMGPRAGESTPELEARYAELKAEWDEHAGDKLITPRSWRATCGQCFERPDEDNPYGTLETHDQHATEEEWAADAEARQWLKERISR